MIARILMGLVMAGTLLARVPSPLLLPEDRPAYEQLEAMDLPSDYDFKGLSPTKRRLGLWRHP